ncbi:acrosomal protein SP-10 isoform X6 [Symphalangus syndactylus]|uniref:acrosomal protein SP-10 isoform X6 n=1 Tax=Symphalangus syndactylus TaxID=9590 RepID=UPI002442AA59|nr:acrosomal protein SP-10 isoform X6 [Symphalangus syndactylus]
MNMFLLLMSLYLLGSARGTSSLPDEPSGSIDHQISVQQLPGEQPSEQPSGEHLSREQPLSEHESGEQPSDEQPPGEHASGEQPSGEHASGEQSLGERALSEEPSGEQASGAPISSTSTGTILNCYTCAYMNDQGKCLRGEGTCITQNSQQCMLKKIFEGGKLQFMVQGCENMCPSMNLFSHGTRMQIICCRNQSFCNKI